LFFLKAGAFIFGSGLAIVPFLREGVVVQHGWLTEREFLDAVAMGLITPGPVVITAGVHRLPRRRSRWGGDRDDRDLRPDLPRRGDPGSLVHPAPGQRQRAGLREKARPQLRLVQCRRPSPPLPEPTFAERRLHDRVGASEVPVGHRFGD
jgi:hypothetical protein